MTTLRPVLNSNFLVDLGDGKARQESHGFSEVLLPEFRQGAGALPPPADPVSHLILKRGVRGSLDLYTWWDQARHGLAPPRPKVTVQLLGADRRTAVLTWTFHQVQPVSLSYSPLRAQENEVVIETLALAFDRFELS